MNIIAKDFTGVIKALLAIGCTDFGSVVWISQPMRSKGVWRAKVAV